MKVLILAVFLFGYAAAQQCGRSAIPMREQDPVQDRIVGGTVVTPHSVPWQCHLARTQSFWGFTSKSYICGCTIVDSQYVITAAHCVAGGNAASFTVTIGEHDKTVTEASQIDHAVVAVISHPNYNGQTIDKDIAVLRLASAITFTDKVQPACIAPAGYKPAPGATLTVTGWGSTAAARSLVPRAQSTLLRSAAVNAVSNDDCNRAYGGAIFESMLCAAARGKDSCQGDSGGPLTETINGRTTLVGVVSWGYGCARDTHPGVYADVGNLRTWVDQQMRM